MNRNEAEDFVYKSYLKAEKYQDFKAKDREKRRPDLTRDLIRSKTETPCAVVTGSKGKGSVANMISQILQTRYKVGLMTSPHIIDFCERFKINGKNITVEDFAYYMTCIKPSVEAIDARLPHDVCISPMGIQALLGLEYFNQNQTDFNVFECGKGAKFDDVNNVLHSYSVINSIFLEHTRELGDSLSTIAEDKSYVITGEQKAVYVAEQAEEALQVIKKRAIDYETPLRLYGIDFYADNVRYDNRGMLFDVIIGEECYHDILVPLMGRHQAKNCALAMALCKDVMGDFELSKVRDNLSRLDWPGRMEVISEDPFILLDACINSASCKNVKDALKHLNMSDVVVVVGIPDDKDYVGVVSEMTEVSSSIILTKSQNPHYVFTRSQSEKLMEQGIKTAWTDSVEDAISMGRQMQKPIVILGTTSLISEVKGIKEFSL